MTTPDADGWITHDGGPCPVDPETLVQIRESNFLQLTAYAARDFDWGPVIAYRIFVPAHTTPGPSPFVRETAARIMAAAVVDNDFMEAMWGCDQEHTVNATAQFAVRAAQALEAALKGVEG